MNRIIILFIGIFVIFSFDRLFADEEKIIIEKSENEESGTVQINNSKINIFPIALPENNIPVNTIKPIYFGENEKNKSYFPAFESEVINTAVANDILHENGSLILELDIKNSKINVIKQADALSTEAKEALELVPDWLHDQLEIKLIELNKNKLDDDYALLIINAADNIKDEVAFCVANMSYQTLTDSRFVSDRDMIVQNAEFIYNVDDSLHYVDLVEYGSIAGKDFYTTTKYRIYDPVSRDTIWNEIPKEIYYWYIVHPKLDQEGVYVSDNNNDNSGQRTYGYSWRDFIWNNPDPAHNYMPVNITTSKGSVASIPRFGELIQTPRFLWNRTETYLPFGREFLNGNSALDIIGNWCSRALPVDVKLPRAFQPNQILMKHNGMCNEDAFLVAGTCRTALIPLIYLTTSAEDHVFGAIWDEDWYHYEFFRGGLQVPGNQFYGITNMLPRGSYGWKVSMAEGFRGDGWVENFTKYYADTCSFQLTVIDSKGTPIEGAMVQIYAPYGNGYAICQRLFTNRKGEVNFAAGEGKQYLVNVYHPVHGWSPQDKSQAYYLVQGNTIKGTLYKVNLAYQNITINEILPGNMNLPSSGEHGFKLKFSATEIITAQSEHDNSQKSRFYKWNSEDDGIVSLFICDSINYDKFTKKQSFSAYNYTGFTKGGELTCALSNENLFYIILQNRASANIMEKVNVSCDLLKGNIQNVEDINFGKTIALYPNPFSENCQIELPFNTERVEIFNALGEKVDTIVYPFIWKPESKLGNGVYFFRANTGEKLITTKGVLFR
ncbi:MAG: T9SS type A sorting domain-containing protein [bacterium]